ncbi:COG1361 S-layer family protein [Haloarcula pelagica]|uniref:COG1361 S-layer family protein n=1 Tax=Haloarcula pelagica TaxID=3033389 RepID=UPI0024C34A7E|nr:CARDB domain-containing protein [Halomicroarcula sp. YJ-61-S]
MTQNMLRNPKSLVTALTVVLVMGFVVSAVPTIATAQASQSGDVIGNPKISFATSSGTLSADTTDELTVSVVNRGLIIEHGPSQYENEVMTARGLTFEVDDENAPIDVQTGRVSVGNFPTGSTERTVSVIVPDHAEPGTYTLPVNYEYSYTRHIRYGPRGLTEGSDSTRTETGSITIQIKEDARFEIVETNATTQVGDDSDISFTLQNTGSETARGASVNVESKSSSLTFESGDTSSTASVGDWEPGEVRTVNYTAALESDAAVRGYSADLAVNYDDSNGVSRMSDPITTTIQSIPEQEFTFTDVESQLRVGEDGDLIGTVRNDGPLPARSVVVQYTGDDQSVIPTEQSTAVGTLDPGQSENFSLPIAISSSAEAGLRSLDMAVKYRTDEGETRTFQELAVDAEIAPERDRFDVTVENRTIQAGGSRTVDVAVTNNLNEVASDVEVRLFADDPLDTGDTDTGYVQSLDPGETKTVTFELTTTGSATVGSTYPISIDFRYDDTDGDSHLTKTYRVPIDVTESEEGGLPLPIIAVVLLIIGTGALVAYRRLQ